MTRTNCVNCGAPLHGHICEYCGTEYDIPKLSPKLDEKTAALYDAYKKTGGNGAVTAMISKLNVEDFQTTSDIQTMLIRHQHTMHSL